MTSPFRVKCRVLVALALSPLLAHASPVSLENPAADQTVSGIGLISGWHCDAKRIEASIDGGVPFAVPVGGSRLDTASACGGRSDTGFGYLIAWSGIPPGAHTLRMTADGVQFAQRTFSVPDLNEWVTGKGQRTTVNDFPVAGQSVVLEWHESMQGFVVIQRKRDSPTLRGRWNGADLERRSGCRAPQNDGNHGTYAQYQVDYGNGSFTIDEAGVTGLTCTYSGTSTQDGANWSIGGTYRCSDGKTGRFDSTSVMVTEREMSLQLTVKLDGSESCTIDKTLGGSRY